MNRLQLPIGNALNKYSRILTQDVTQPAAQAMYYAIGFTEEDFKKAQVGIASMGWDGNPCNMHLNDLATTVRKSVNKAEGLLGLALLYHWRKRWHKHGHRWYALQPGEPRCDCR